MNTLEGFFYLGIVIPLISGLMNLSVSLIKDDRFSLAVDSCRPSVLELKISEQYEAGDG